MSKQSEKGCSHCHQLFDLYETEYCQPCAKAVEKTQNALLKIFIAVLCFLQLVTGGLLVFMSSG